MESMIYVGWIFYMMLMHFILEIEQWILWCMAFPMIILFIPLQSFLGTIMAGVYLIFAPTFSSSSLRRPYSRLVFRQYIQKGIMPIYTFYCSTYAFMGYTVDPAHAFYFWPRSMWNQHDLNHAIQTVVELLDPPWSLLCGRISDVPNGVVGETCGLIMVVLAFLLPLCQAILGMYSQKLIASWNYWRWKSGLLKEKLVLMLNSFFKCITSLGSLFGVVHGSVLERWRSVLERWNTLRRFYFTRLIFFGPRERGNGIDGKINTRMTDGPRFNGQDSRAYAPKVLVTCQHILTADKLTVPSSHIHFDADSTTAVVDNSANVHIWNCKKDFSTYKSLDNAITPGVSTISSGNTRPAGVGTLPISWKNDSGSLYHVE